ncbi:MAG: hypothetical protein ACLRSW_11290 [Christensenellaceae bacterium]
MKFRRKMLNNDKSILQQEMLVDPIDCLTIPPWITPRRTLFYRQCNCPTSNSKY